MKIIWKQNIKVDIIPESLREPMLPGALKTNHSKKPSS